MGHFIFKFLRELNSATSAKMMVLSIVFGLIAGFLPAVNFFTFVIFFVVLIFRIPIGLFLASFSFFEFLGYFLDPVFHKTGAFLLKSSFLEPLWTFLYNIPLFRWSGFNNTIVMGSLVLGIVFGIILYFVLSKLILIYRNIVFSKLKKSKILSWLVPGEKKGIIRIAGIGFIVFGAGVTALFFIFLLDPIVKYSLEFSLSHILHKKVAVGSVDTSVKNLSVNIKNMQIGDILFKKVYTKLDWNKIVWRKYKIDDLTFIAQTDKNIYDLIKSHNKKQNPFKSISNINIKLPSPKDFLAKQNLKSLEAIKKLQKDYKKTQKDIKNLKTDKYKKEFDELKKKLDSMKNVKINNPADLENLIANINSVKKDADNLLKKIKKDKSILINDKKLITADLKNVKIALKEDKNNINSKYKMIKNKEYMKFAESFLKPQIAKYVKLGDEIYQKIKPYLHKSNKSKKEYIRHKGVYVKFKDKILYPDFVLVKSLGELKTSIAKWSLKADNISDNQALLNKNALIKIKGKSRFFDVGAKASYLNKIYFSAYGNKIKLKKLDINFADLNALLNAKIKGVLFNENINAKIFAYLTHTKFDNLNKNIKKYLGNSLSQINNFKIIVNLKGQLNSPVIKISSDLDKIFAKILQSRVNELINKNILKTQNLLNNKISKSLKGVNLSGVDSKLNLLNSFGNIKKLIDNKAFDIIKSKQKSTIGNAVKRFLPF